nr:hypothetical protein [Akkermansia muciniphila]
MGPHQPRLHQTDGKRRHALHPNRFLLLQGTGAGQKDASPEIHDCRHPAGQAAVVLLWRSGQHSCQRRPGGGTGILPGGQAALCPAPGPDDVRTHPLRQCAPQAPADGRPLLRLHQGPRAGIHGGCGRSLWKLGIPAKTRHNEVAPGQFEIAPIFESQNLAVDHNMLVMEVLRKTANKHDMVCLLHEKPFSGMNGSGKHNNWSLSAPGYGSLLNPGSSPQENAIFLTLLCATIKAVDEHADLLRASVAKSGNEHRLGAHEAPPAIISIFLGDLLDEIIEQIEKGGTKKARTQKTINIGVDTLPMFPLDASDRNRTSPFAFTGNKFEFRAVGSSQTCAWPMTVLNTIVAESLDEICTILEPVKDKPEEFHATLNKLLQNIIKKHKRILFSGDGYGEAWVEEAERRNLPNIPGTIEALAALETPKAKALFEKYKVVSPVELHARHEIQTEIFHKEINIEAETALLMVETLYIPAVTEQLTQLTTAIAQMKASGIKAGMKATTDRANQIGTLLDILPGQVRELRRAVDEADTRAIQTGMDNLRSTIDMLESLTDADLWPVPTYAELLFL